VATALLHKLIGNPVHVTEELHFQALLSRAVATEGTVATLLRSAVDHLYAWLADAGIEINRDLVEDALSLDLAATTILRTSRSGRVSEADFALSARGWDLLVEGGDVPASASDVEVGGVVRGVVRPPQRWVYFPLGVYALSIWHGTGRPLHDVQLDFDQLAVTA
jgi:hypothetical protein